MPRVLEFTSSIAHRGFDAWEPLWLVGGINRRHPNERDLSRVAECARRIQTAIKAG